MARAIASSSGDSRITAARLPPKSISLLKSLAARFLSFSAANLGRAPAEIARVAIAVAVLGSRRLRKHVEGNMNLLALADVLAGRAHLGEHRAPQGLWVARPDSVRMTPMTAPPCTSPGCPSRASTP